MPRHKILNSKQIQMIPILMTKTYASSQVIIILKIGISNLPFGFAQGGESFDSAQDREPVERLVEPFRISCLGFRI